MAEKRLGVLVSVDPAFRSKKAEIEHQLRVIGLHDSTWLEFLGVFTGWVDQENYSELCNVDGVKVELSEAVSIPKNKSST